MQEKRRHKKKKRAVSKYRGSKELASLDEIGDVLTDEVPELVDAHVVSGEEQVDDLIVSHCGDRVQLGLGDGDRAGWRVLVQLRVLVASQEPSDL